ncbi:MAG: hypothetical protein ABIO91_07060, partial [Pyrinomonadaceae bacterium]
GRLSRKTRYMKILFSALVIATLSFSLSAQIKKPGPPAVKTPFTESRQALIVTTKDWNATQGEARMYERSGPSGKWQSKGDAFPVVVGRSGLAWSQDSVAAKMTQFKQKEMAGRLPGCSRSPSRSARR